MSIILYRDRPGFLTASPDLASPLPALPAFCAGSLSPPRPGPFSACILPPLSPLSAKLAILTPGCRALFGHPVRVGSGQDDHLQTRDRMSRMRLPLRHPFGSLSMKWRGENRINSLSRKPSPFQGGSSLYFHVRCCMRDILSLRAHGVPVRSYMAWGGVNCIKIPGFIQIFFTGFD